MTTFNYPQVMTMTGLAGSELEAFESRLGSLTWHQGSHSLHFSGYYYPSRELIEHEADLASERAIRLQGCSAGFKLISAGAFARGVVAGDPCCIAILLTPPGNLVCSDTLLEVLYYHRRHFLNARSFRRLADAITGEARGDSSRRARLLDTAREALGQYGLQTPDIADRIKIAEQLRGADVPDETSPEYETLAWHALLNCSEDVYGSLTNVRVTQPRMDTRVSFYAGGR